MSRLRLSRRGRRTVLFVSALIGLTAIVAILAFDPLLRWLVVRQAREEGVELTLGSVQASWDHLRLRRFSFGLVGVDGVLGEVERLDVALSGTTPESIKVRGLSVEAWGAPLALALSLSVWADGHASLLSLPTRAREVSLSWRPALQGEPWVALGAGVVAPDSAGGGDLDGDLQVLGSELGRLGLSWTASEARFALTLQPGAPARIQGTVRWADATPQATLTLALIPLQRLAQALRLPLAYSGISVGGRLDLSAEQVGAPVRLRGQLELTVQGLELPLPAEARAIAFGSTTEVTSRILVDVAERRVALDDLRVTHGGLALRGRGRIESQAGNATATLKLSGSLSCAELARAAAQGRIGGVLGRMVGGVAGRVVGGSVSVDVDIVADLRRLDAAKVKQRIGVGCDLRPGQLLPALPRW